MWNPDPKIIMRCYADQEKPQLVHSCEYGPTHTIQGSQQIIVTTHGGSPLTKVL